MTFLPSILYLLYKITKLMRQYRQLSNEVKKKISDSMKKYHAQRGTEKQRSTNKQISNSMKRYWSTIGNQPK